MILIACDPASKKCAFAEFRNFEFEKVYKCETDLNTLNGSLPSENFMLAIETQYSSFNAKTLVKLVEARMKVEIMASLSGCKGIYHIAPATWQKMLSRKKMMRNERKELAKQLASKVAGEEIKDSDIADAICLGLYVLENYETLEVEKTL